MKIYSNLKLENKIKLILKLKGYKKDYLQQYLFVLSHIRTYPFINKTNCLDGFTPVNIDVLRTLVSYNMASNILKDLEEFNVIVSDKSFKRGFKSKGYLINDEFLNDKMNLFTLTDTILLKKIEKKIKYNIKANEKFNFAYKLVTDNANILKINKSKTIEYIKSLQLDKEKQEAYILSAENFNTMKFTTKDSTSNRLHNNLTNFPSKLRKFIRYKNKELGQCDIKNSQPFFLLTIIKNIKDIPKEEKEYFEKVVIELGFYEFFALKLNVDLNKNNRKEFKERIFGGVLFDKNRKKLTKYEAVFNKEFPFIFKKIREIKKDNHNALAILLQKEESSFVFSFVEKYYNKKPNTPLMTIHDSIVSFKDDLEDIKNSLCDYFTLKYKTCPKIIVELFV